jgi:hypothetical protein
MEYNAHELWCGKVYPSLNIKKRKERLIYTKKLIDLFQKNLGKIKDSIGGIQLKENRIVENRGTHISFPRFEFRIGEANINCRIRVNPCWFYPERGIIHYSKFFVILGSNYIQNSKSLKSFFFSLTEKAKFLQDKIKEIVDQIREEGLEKCDCEIFVKNVGVPISSENNIFSSKVMEVRMALEEEKFQEIIRDILCLHYNEEINNPLERLRESNIHWRIIRCNPQLIYGVEADKGNNIAKFTGFAGLDKNGEFEILHSLFKSRIIQIINIL